MRSLGSLCARTFDPGQECHRLSQLAENSSVEPPHTTRTLSPPRLPASAPRSPPSRHSPPRPRRRWPSRPEERRHRCECGARAETVCVVVAQSAAEMFVPSLIRYRRGVAASRPKTTRTPSARIPIAISPPMIITIFLEPLRTMRSRRQPGMLTRPRLRWRFQTPVEDDRRSAVMPSRIRCTTGRICCLGAGRRRLWGVVLAAPSAIVVGYRLRHGRVQVAS